MNVGIYTVWAHSHPDFLGAVSGHVQIPLMTADLLLQRGHQVTLITTDAPPGYLIPPISARGLWVHKVINASRRFPESGIYPARALLQVASLRRYLQVRKFDIVHFVGSRGTAYLLGLMKATGLSTPAVMTLVTFASAASLHRRFLDRVLISCIDRIATLTEFTRDELVRVGFQDVTVIRPGVFKRLDIGRNVPSCSETPARNKVLFWRNANARNGADICIQAFEYLSPRYKEIDFVFAVRPWDQLEAAVLDAAKRYENIHTYLYPYGEGITLEGLLQSSICAVLPLRRLSINPQMAILETMCAGCPVVTTNIESNKEIVDDRETGILIQPGSVEETISAIDFLLTTPRVAAEMGKLGSARAMEKWNWWNYECQLIDLYRRLLGDSAL